MGDKTDAWMPLWIGAYLADTMKLTTLQHGAYFLLLISYWRERSPLADDDEELRSITKTDKAEWKRLRPVLAKFFRVADGVWWHKRVEAEIAAADERSKKSSEKAKKAAEARWGAGDKHAASNAPSMPQALPKDVLEECPTPSPTSSLRSEDISSALPESKYPPEFESAWRAYPDRPGKSKADACKAWKARRAAGVSAEALQAGVDRYAAFCRETGKVGTEYVKQPATFFGPGEHYLADWTPPPASANQGKANGAPAHKYAAAAAAIYDGVFDDAHH